jgi:hypothetical protein
MNIEALYVPGVVTVMTLFLAALAYASLITRGPR